MVIDFSFIGILSLAVGFAALGTTIIIAHNQGKLTDEIHQSVKEQEKLLSDTRNFYAAAFGGYVQFISERYAAVITLYEDKFKGKPESEEKEKARQMLKNNFDDLLIKKIPTIDSIELVRIFGREITEKYWSHITKTTSNFWLAGNDFEMALMIYEYIKQMQKLIELKNIFLPFCVGEYSREDSNFQSNYDLIEKFANSAVKPIKEDFQAPTDI